MKHRLIPVLALGGCIVPAISSVEAQGCSAEFVEAFKSTYNLSSENTLAEVVHQVACNELSADGEARIPLDGILIGVGGKTTQEACKTKDRAFFEQNASIFAAAFLPPEALKTLEGCFHGEGLALQTEFKEPNIAITAKWTPPFNGAPVEAKIVRDLVILPSELVKCEKLDLVKGGTVGPGSSRAHCSILQGAASATLHIILSTNLESVANFVSIARAPEKDCRISVQNVRTKKCAANGVYAGPNQVDEHGGTCIYANGCRLTSIGVRHKICGDGIYIGPNQAKEHGGSCVELKEEGWSLYVTRQNTRSRECGNAYYAGPNPKKHGGTCFEARKTKS